MLCAYWPPRLSPYERPSWVLFSSRVKLGIVGSAPSRRGTFRPIFSGPSGSHSHGHKPRRCSYPALPPSAFHFPATRSWKVGAGQEQVEQCFAARVWVPRASGHFPDGPVGGDDPRSLLGGGGGVCQQDPHPTPERFQGRYLSTGPNPNLPLLRCIL